MKHFLTLFSLLCIALIACDKVEDSQKETPQQSFLTFNATIKDGFTGEFGEVIDPFRNLKNIMVGDYIPYTITITDSIAKADKQLSTKYVITPTKTRDRNHQSLQVDYEIYLENENGEKIKVVQPRIEFGKTGVYKFYIKPLVAGSFQIPFILEKEQEGKKIGKQSLPTINFNAVKITIKRFVKSCFAGFPHNCSDIYIKGFRFSGIYIYYDLVIDDGDNETDIYLSAGGKQTLKIMCDKYTSPEKDVKVGEKYTFEDYDKNVCRSIRVIIVQKIDEQQEEYRIEYYNVPIIEPLDFLN